MAIVQNLALQGMVAADRPYCTYNRTNAGTPNAALTPQYAGEIIFDTTNKVRWIATSLLNSSWRPVSEAEVT